MPLTTRIKQPSESRLYDFDFTKLLVNGAVLNSIIGVTQFNIGLVAGSGSLTLGAPILASPIVQIRISGGTAKEKYKLTCIATDNAGNTLECDGILRVKDL